MTLDTNNKLPYYPFSSYLVEKYGEKVYKLPVNLNLTCPNLDGNMGVGGCIFCNNQGGSYENLSSSLSIKEQVKLNKQKMQNRFGVQKFIVYFQSYTNTYQSLKSLQEMVLEIPMENVVRIDIATRPDCISVDQLAWLAEFQTTTGIDITLELGLQTANYHTLKRLNRGHGLSEFVECQLMANHYNLRTCVHLILALPWDDEVDTVETARLMNVTKVKEVKLHSLYIARNTVLGEMYKRGEVALKTKEEFIVQTISFLRHLDKAIVVQRLLGRAPESDSLFCNWSESWWKIRDEIVLRMNQANDKQGDLQRKFGEILNNR